jgi:hypothetical protein
MNVEVLCLLAFRRWLVRHALRLEARITALGRGEAPRRVALGGATNELHAEPSADNEPFAALEVQRTAWEERRDG